MKQAITASRYLLLLLATFSFIGPAALAASVTSYGAVANDGIDDSTAFQNCINANAYTYIPSGEWKLDSVVNIGSNKTVEGSGYGSCDIRISGATARAFRFNESSNSTLKEINIDRGTDNNTESAVQIDESDNITVHRVRVVDNRSRSGAIVAQYSEDVTITQCNIYDYQRQIYEDGSWQVNGVGIVCYYCDDITVENNKVIQNDDLSLSSSKHDWFQSSAIAASECAGGSVSCNLIEWTGQGIDTSGSSSLDVYNNWMEQLHICGIKMVNGSNYMDVKYNFVRQAGICAIWLAWGNPGPGSHHNIVQHNIFDKTGQGIGGNGYWNGWFDSTVPAGVHLEKAPNLSTRVSDNNVKYNDAYDNGSMPWVVKEQNYTYAPYANDIQDNDKESGNAPTSPFAQNCGTVE